MNERKEYVMHLYVYNPNDDITKILTEMVVPKAYVAQRESQLLVIAVPVGATGTKIFTLTQPYILTAVRAHSWAEALATYNQSQR